MARTIERYAGELHEVRPNGRSERPATFPVHRASRQAHRDPGSRRVTATATLVGRSSTIDIHLASESDPCPPGAPLVCASEVGLSPLGMAISGHPSRAVIGALADWMRETDSGAYIALVDAPPAPRPLGIVQDDRSGGKNRNFYERHRPDGRIWRDFYYATINTLIGAMDGRWSAADIELTHPTGFGWRDGLLPTVLEAIGHLADERELALKRVHISCRHDLSEAEVQKAIETLNREQLRSDRPTHRDLRVEAIAAETVVPRAPTGARIQRIEMAASRAQT